MSHVVPRAVRVAASPLQRSQPTGPCKVYVDLVLEEGIGVGAVIKVLAFKNHFAQYVTVRVRDRHGAWSDVLRDQQLMQNPHYEDDARLTCVLEMPDGVWLEPKGAIRLYFSNPSPRWADVGNVEHVAVYDAGDVDDIELEVTRRALRALRVTRVGEDDVSHLYKNQAQPPPPSTTRRRVEKNTLSDLPFSSASNTGVLAASEDVRRALRAAGISRTEASDMLGANLQSFVEPGTHELDENSARRTIPRRIVSLQ